MGQNTTSASAGAKTLAEKKYDLKQSIASMMVYWIAHTRHNLRAELLDNNQNGELSQLSLRQAFTDEEWEDFFSETSRLFNETAVRDGAERINARTDGKDGQAARWAKDLVTQCPSAPYINIMYDAAAALVDSTFTE